MTMQTAPMQQRAQGLESFVSTAEVAEFLNKPESWVYANAGPLGLPRYRLGNQWRYRLSEVADWMAAQ